jgi:O-methyltransferase
LAVNEVRYRRLHEKYKGYTMNTWDRCYAGNLHLSARVKGIDGVIFECGTWRGGMIAGIADVLGSERRYYLCDSFQGLPKAKEIDDARAQAWQADTTAPAYYNNCTASEDEARAAMSMSRAKDYHLVKGWFEDTLPKLPPEPIALLRRDADWYDSTKCILDNLADRVVPGGLIIVDDYYNWVGCTIAVNEFAARTKRPIRESHHEICYIVA